VPLSSEVRIGIYKAQLLSCGRRLYDHGAGNRLLPMSCGEPVDTRHGSVHLGKLQRNLAARGANPVHFHLIHPEGPCRLHPMTG